MAVSTLSSTGGVFASHTGTLQEVIDALDTAGQNNPRDQNWTYDDTNAKYTCVVLTGSTA